MSSSDNIKEALQTAFPSSSPKDWKRRSKAKDGQRTRREFEHPRHGSVVTFEEPDGTITIDGLTPEGIGAVAAAVDSGDVAAAKERVGKLIEEAEARAPGMMEQIAAGMKKLSESDRILSIENPDQIKSGDRVRIPTGTKVYSYSDYEGGSLGQRWLQEEDNETTVVDVVTIADYLSMAKPESCIRIADLKEEVEREGIGGLRVMPTYSPSAKEEQAFAECRFLLHWVFGETENDPKRRSYWLQRSDKLKEALQAVKEEVEAEWGPDPRFVMWGSPHARLVALIDDVEKVADKSQYQIAAAPKKKEKAITKRSMMVPGSTWKFTQDVEIKVWVRNPKIDELIRKRDSQPRRLGQYGSGPVADACQTEINRLLREESQVEILGAIIKAGTVIKVVGKISASGLYSYGREKSNGLLVPVIRESGEPMQVSGAIKSRSWVKLPGKKEERIDCALVPYSQIEKIVEAESVPESVVYVLRDRETGDYFGGWQTETIKQDNGYEYERSTNDPKMSSTFSGAKKYKTSAAAKASIRDFTGYNEGLDDEGGAQEWVGIGYASKKMDLPETWELVGIDKTTNAEKSVEDIQTWFKGLMRLRVLTKGHGPAVRAAFKKAEGVEGIESILLFTNYDGDRPYSFEDSYRDEGKEAIKRIDAATKNFTKKPIRVRSPASVAFACSFDDAVLGKMTFAADPNIKVKILDSTTLEEMVEAQ